MAPPSPRKVLLFAMGLGSSGIVVASLAKVLQEPEQSRNVAPPAASVASASAAPVAPSASATAPGLIDELPPTLEAQREVMFENMKHQLGSSDAVLARIREIFASTDWMGQGNPKVTEHPMSRRECLEIRGRERVVPGDARCGAPNMVPIYDPGSGETAETANLCIDQYEFPNIPCDYPVTWVRADLAQDLCDAQGKRLCDAHEWEGACAGAVLPAQTEYAFGKPRLFQEHAHNQMREITWAYGKEKNHSLCGTGSKKNAKCVAPTWQHCGTNTYPAGAFPACVSPFGVYDQHGNAAEHMNLPLVDTELGSRGGAGETEMKGSWFIFASYEAHIDDCRWRAPAWHAGKVRSRSSHHNYHLGFRCCKDVGSAAPPASVMPQKSEARQP
jgi:hypothetical protein